MERPTTQAVLQLRQLLESQVAELKASSRRPRRRSESRRARPADEGHR